MGLCVFANFALPARQLVPPSDTKDPRSVGLPLGVLGGKTAKGALQAGAKVGCIPLAELLGCDRSCSHLALGIRAELRGHGGHLRPGLSITHRERNLPSGSCGVLLKEKGDLLLYTLVFDIPRPLFRHGTRPRA